MTHDVLIIGGGIAGVSAGARWAESGRVLLPHMRSSTQEGRIELGEKVPINIKPFADGHRPPDLVVPSMV